MNPRDQGLEAVFKPKSVAIIGASRTPGKVGHTLLKNLLECGYGGRVYPINPHAEEILGVGCYPSVLRVPGEIDLAVVAVPAPIVLGVAEECGEKGVEALIVISAGFRETGREGAERERRLLEIARRHGMRIQGPNCLGVIDTYTPLNLSFAPAMPRRGSIAFVSQSGALGTAALDWAMGEGIGFSHFISLGNKADLNEVNFLEALGGDEKVKAIILYVESIEEGERFVGVAREATRRKPIIVLKGGVSKAGSRAAGSHTGALVGSYTAYRAAFEKSGVLSTEGVEELFNYAVTLTEQPLPRGEGVAIVTNAGGPGIVFTDLCEKYGLKLARLSPETHRDLREGLPPAAATGNPIDVLGDARADRYRYALERVLADGRVYAAAVILTPQAMTESLATAEVVVEMRDKFPDKPLLTVFMGGGEVEEASRYLRERGVPCFDFPEKAVRTLSALYAYTRYLKRPVERPLRFDDVDAERVEAILKGVRRDGRVVLLPPEASEVVRAYGVEAPEMRVATSAEEAVEYAEELGYPVVLKVVSPDILHKTDIGGVVLNLESAEEVRSAYRGIIARVSRHMPQARLYGVLVSSMVPQGREMIIGMSRDVQFGPLIMFGLGGIYVNFLRDVSFALAPLSRREAKELIRETRAYTLLRGIRGERPADLEALRETILRVGQLSVDFPEILELDINPLMVYEEGRGCIAVDVKITLGVG